MGIPFGERASTMGLTPNEFKGLYEYSDKYGDIVYRKLASISIVDDHNPHVTDDMNVPLLGIFTRAPYSEDVFEYCGYVSELYQFVGNDVLNENIRSSISEVGMPIMTENIFMSEDFTRMRNEIIIRSAQEVAHTGDVLPVLIVNNSYNGTKAATVSFGIATYYNSEQVTFAFSLGEMRQVHIENSSVQMASAVSSYMEVFAGSISDMITNSFNTTLTEDQMLGTLDVIDRIGKKRRKEISKLLQEMNSAPEGEDPLLPSAWHMFLAIVRYSSFEPNINIRRLLENVAESVLVIPTRMYGVLERLQST